MQPKYLHGLESLTLQLHRSLGPSNIVALLAAAKFVLSDLMHKT